MSLLKKGLSDSKYYLIANLGNKALAFLIIPILARSVGVKEFANYDLFLVISTFLNILIVLGTDSGIVILLAESREDNNKLSFLYVMTLIISLSILLFISLIGSIIFLYKDELFLLKKEIWVYIALYVGFNVINYHTFNFLRWREKAKEASFITLFAYVCGMLIGVLFLYFNNRVEAYLNGLVIGVGIGATLALLIAREYIANFKIIKESKATLKELFILSIPFIPNYLGNSLMQMADRFVILALFTKYELGIYAVITKLAMIPQIIIGTLIGGFLPVMYNNYKNRDGQKLIKRFFHTYIIFIPLAFVIAYLLKDFAVDIFAGSKYINYSYLLPIALISILFVRSSQANGFGYSIKRKTHYIMYITFFTVLINYILSYIFGYYIGLEGVLLGTLFAGIVKTYLYTFYSEKLYSFNYSFKLIAISSFVTFILVVFTSKGVLV